jgi:hypothetical protein
MQERKNLAATFIVAVRFLPRGQVVLADDGVAEAGS